MNSVFTLSAVNRGFEPRLWVKPKIMKLVFVALGRKNKDWLVWNHVNVPRHVYQCMLIQWASTTKIQRRVLVLYKADLIIIVSSDVTCSRHNIAEKKCSFGVKQQTRTNELTVVHSTLIFCIHSCVKSFCTHIFPYVFHIKQFSFPHQ